MFINFVSWGYKNVISGGVNLLQQWTLHLYWCGNSSFLSYFITLMQRNAMRFINKCKSMIAIMKPI